MRSGPRAVEWTLPGALAFAALMQPLASQEPRIQQIYPLMVPEGNEAKQEHLLMWGNALAGPQLNRFLSAGGNGREFIFVARATAAQHGEIQHQIRWVEDERVLKAQLETKILTIPPGEWKALGITTNATLMDLDAVTELIKKAHGLDGFKLRSHAPVDAIGEGRIVKDIPVYVAPLLDDHIGVLLELTKNKFTLFRLERGQTALAHLPGGEILLLTLNTAERIERPEKMPEIERRVTRTYDIRTSKKNAARQGRFEMWARALLPEGKPPDGVRLQDRAGATFSARVTAAEHEVLEQQVEWLGDERALKAVVKTTVVTVPPKSAPALGIDKNRTITKAKEVSDLLTQIKNMGFGAGEQASVDVLDAGLVADSIRIWVTPLEKAQTGVLLARPESGELTLFRLEKGQTAVMPQPGGKGEILFLTLETARKIERLDKK